MERNSGGEDSTWCSCGFLVVEVVESGKEEKNGSGGEGRWFMERESFEWVFFSV